MKQTYYRLCVCGVLAALVFVATAVVHIPSHTGYIHVGDAFIYLAACLLPHPYAAAAGAVGAALSDALTGYAIWVPGTVIIKAAAVFFFTARRDKLLCPRNLLALLPSFAVCIGGYYVYEALITSNWVAPLAGLLPSLMQCVASAVVFVLLAAALDRLKLKKHL